MQGYKVILDYAGPEVAPLPNKTSWTDAVILAILLVLLLVSVFWPLLLIC